MGNNFAYTVFEKTVIGAYDLGKLDKALLTVLMEPYRGLDVDSGGSVGLITHDGKTLEQVVVETWGLECPVRPDESSAAMHDVEQYWERMSDLFDLVKRHFEWW